MNPIIVEVGFEIWNGFSGMKRDVVLRLFLIIEYRHCGMDVQGRDECIRSLIGICQEDLEWKNHSYFLECRKRFMSLYCIRDMMVILHGNSNNGFAKTNTPAGPKITLSVPDWRTFFIITGITDGIFSWIVKFNFQPAQKCSFGIGIARPISSRCNVDPLGVTKGTCALHFDMLEDGSCQSNLRGVIENSPMPSINTPISNGSLVASLEIDCDTRRASFFIDGKQFPHAVSHMPIPLYLGVCGKGTQCSFISIAFRRRQPPRRVYPPVCEFYEFKEVDN